MTRSRLARAKNKTWEWVHQTEDGPVHLEVTAAPGGGWKARFWGKQLEGYGTCKTSLRARRLLQRCFAEMYPKHRCVAACGPVPRPDTLRQRKPPVVAKAPSHQRETGR